MSSSQYQNSSSSHQGGIPAAAREILGEGRTGTTQTHETIAPAVVQETIAKNVREETQIVEDREQ